MVVTVIITNIAVTSIIVVIDINNMTVIILISSIIVDCCYLYIDRNKDKHAVLAL